MIVPAPRRILTALAIAGALGIALQANSAGGAPKDEQASSPAPKGKSAASKEKAAAPKDKGAAPKDKAAAPKDKATAPKDKAAAAKAKASREQGQILGRESEHHRHDPP